MRLAAATTLVAILSCEAAVPMPAKNGWGPSRDAPPPSTAYPAIYPRVSDSDRRAREAELQRELPGWQVRVAASGYFAYAHTIDVPQSMSLASSEIATAQRLIDRHPALFGLARPERLERWHDGLYFISPVHDPRYGIAVLHARGIFKIMGHLWPGFTMRSTARKDPSALLAPWLGRRFGRAPRPSMPCDPVSRDPRRDCPASDTGQSMTITADGASYVVFATPSGSNIEVREVLTLPSTRDMLPIDGKKEPVPSAVDARTGEEIAASAYGPGLCELEGPCVLWGWFQDERHLEFDDAAPPTQ